MALARVTGLAAVLVAVLMAALIPSGASTGLPILVGWTGVVALAVGVGLGEGSAIVLAGVAFIVRIAMQASLSGAAVPPVLVQVPLLVLAIELAVISLDARVRPGRLTAVLLRASGSVLVAGAAAAVLELAVGGVSGGGLLLRVVALATVVVLAGWVTLVWSKAVE